MANERVIWRNSIFTRMVITFLLIMVPLYILGVQIYRSSRDMLSQQIFDSMQSQVTFYMNNLTEDIRRVNKLQLDCLDDEDLNNLANASELMSDYERTKAVTRLQQRLTTIKNSCIYIQNVSAIIPSINRTINAAGTGRGSIEDMNDAEFKKLSDIKSDLGSLIIYWNKSVYMSALPTSSYYSENLPSFIIVVELSKSALKNVLIQSDITRGVRSMLVQPVQKLAITSESDAEVSKDFQDFVNKDIEKIKNNPSSVTMNGQRYFAISATSDYLGFILCRYIPEEVVFEPLKKYHLWFWAFSILAVIIIVFYSLSTYKFIQAPLKKLVKSFGKVESGEFDIKIKLERNDEFRYIYTRFNEMVFSLKTLIDQVYKQKILAQKAELKQLQSQINPHFLYNSFFILQRRISKGDYENAERFCEGLGSYFKFITRSGSDEVILVKEVEHARIYADIQAMRFSNRIKVEFENLPGVYDNIMVPRLIIQPIIENAFEHGLEDKETGGLLKVSFQETENILKIIIEDNGDMLKESDLEELRSILGDIRESTETTGIINIHKRIRLMLGDKSGVSASRGELGGLKIEICLQVEEE